LKTSCDLASVGAAPGQFVSYVFNATRRNPFGLLLRDPL
jgi:hypothetical protein